MKTVILGLALMASTSSFATSQQSKVTILANEIASASFSLKSFSDPILSIERHLNKDGKIIDRTSYGVGEHKFYLDIKLKSGARKSFHIDTLVSGECASATNSSFCWFNTKDELLNFLKEAEKSQREMFDRTNQDLAEEATRKLQDILAEEGQLILEPSNSGNKAISLISGEDYMSGGLSVINGHDFYQKFNDAPLPTYKP